MIEQVRNGEQNSWEYSSTYPSSQCLEANGVRYGIANEAPQITTCGICKQGVHRIKLSRIHIRRYDESSYKSEWILTHVRLVSWSKWAIYQLAVQYTKIIRPARASFIHYGRRTNTPGPESSTYAPWKSEMLPANEPNAQALGLPASCGKSWRLNAWNTIGITQCHSIPSHRQGYVPIGKDI